MAPERAPHVRSQLPHNAPIDVAPKAVAPADVAPTDVAPTDVAPTYVAPLERHYGRDRDPRRVGGGGGRGGILNYEPNATRTNSA